MRIVHITSYVIPGLGYEEPYLARHQARHGHDVTIITSNLLYPLGSYAVLAHRFERRQIGAGSEPMDGVTLIRLPARDIGSRIWLHGLPAMVTSCRPNIVHCHNLLQLHPWRIALLKSVHRLECGLVVDDHMHEAFRRRGAVAAAVYATFRHLGYPLLSRYVDAFCAIAEDTREYLRIYCGVKNALVMPLGVDTETFHQAGRRERHMSRTELGIPDDSFVVIYVGKVIPAKRIDVLGSAIAQLNAERTSAIGLVVGDVDDDYRRRLEADYPDLVFVGGVHHEHLSTYYGAADAAVWPAQESMSVFEAMAMGLPVAVAAGTGISRIVEAAGAGSSFAMGDASALTSQLSSFRGGAGPSLGSRGRGYVEASLSWDTCAARYEDLYQSVLRRRAAA